MKKVLLLTLVIAFMSSSLAYAWSGLSTVWVSANQNWQLYLAIESERTGVDENWDLRVETKTMWSAPHIELAASSGITVTDELRGDLGTQTGYENYGEIGEKYYPKMKPSAWQTGKDAIELEVNAR